MFHLLLNLKGYEASVGSQAQNFLQGCPESNSKPGWKISYAVNPIDLACSSRIPKREIISQHVDPNPCGPYTGKISIDSLISIGIRGSLLNHSENRIPLKQIELTIQRARSLGFEIIVCAADEAEVAMIAKLSPNSIAYEPPALIGGNISVSSSKPEIIEKAGIICGKYGVNLFVGAGIKNNDDVKKSLDLGANGVLVASGVVLSKNPIHAINSLINF
ncbi:MAG: triose-phosphate isomerase [Thermoplasmatales archaeon]